MSPMPTHEIMTLDEALETVFSVLQSMQTVVDITHLHEAGTATEEVAQQSVHLLKLFLTPLREAYSALLEHQP